MNFIVTITAILIVMNTLDEAIVVVPSFIVFIFAVFITLFYIIRERNVRFIKSGGVVLFIAFISLCFNIDIIFKPLSPWLRYSIFFVMLLGFGPILDGKKIAMFRMQLFETTFQLMFVVVLGSFLMYLFKVNIFPLHHSGLYKGLVTHSMMMSPLSALCALYFVNKICQNSGHKIRNLAFLILCILSCVLAASRGALGALVLALLFYTFVRYKNNLKKFFRNLAIFLVVVILTVPVWTPYTLSLSTKIEQRKEQDDVLSGRGVMWESLLKDFQMRPLFGVGYNNIYHKQNLRLNFSGDKVIFEPGTGWLLTLSTLGIFGFLSTLFLFFNKAGYILKNHGYIDNALLYLSVIVFFSIHLLFEGYIFGVGSSMFVLLWLTVALVNQKNISTYPS